MNAGAQSPEETEESSVGFFSSFISTGGNQPILNQWIGLLVKNAMSQLLKLQLLPLLLQSSIHNLSPSTVLSCLSQHITSLHFLKVSSWKTNPFHAVTISLGWLLQHVYTGNYGVLSLKLIGELLVKIAFYSIVRLSLVK